MLLNNRYQLHEPIGRGGQATIYRAFDDHMERVVAIKVLREVYSSDPKFVRRFQKEAEVMYSLSHPNIVQVYDYGYSNGNYYIVMELIESIDLRLYLRSKGILDAENTVKIAHGVALGLGAAHRLGIVHRAVIPQHIMMGNAGSIKVCSFSLASVKGMSREESSTTSMSLNIVPYYPPEQARGEIVTPTADVYSLGMVMYEMVTGHPPFDADSPVKVAMQHIQDIPKLPSLFNPTIPTVHEEIIMRCLEKEPDRRYSDGSQLASALEAMMEV